MYIGLIDDDLRVRSWSIPNLEIMKLSAFHKKNRDLVELVTDYRTYTRYSKLYLRRNGADSDLPALLLSKARDKCEYGGYAFTNGLYVPLEKEIEESLPDVTIYDKIKLDGKGSSKDFRARLNKGLMRLQTAQTIPSGRGKAYLIYDKNAIQYELLKDVIEVANRVEFVEPQFFNNLDDAEWFARQEKFNHTTKINYLNSINSEEAKRLSSIDFKNKIYYTLIPESYANVDFITGMEIIKYYFDQIENVKRFNGKLSVRNPFKNKDLEDIIIAINSGGDPNNIEKRLKFNLIEKNYNLLTNQYSHLYTRIKILWRYNTYGKA